MLTLLFCEYNMHFTQLFTIKKIKIKIIKLFDKVKKHRSYCQFKGIKIDDQKVSIKQ